MPPEQTRAAECRSSPASYTRPLSLWAEKTIKRFHTPIEKWVDESVENCHAENSSKEGLPKKILVAGARDHHKSNSVVDDSRNEGCYERQQEMRAHEGSFCQPEKDRNPNVARGGCPEWQTGEKIDEHPPDEPPEHACFDPPEDAPIDNEEKHDIRSHRIKACVRDETFLNDGRNKEH